MLQEDNSKTTDNIERYKERLTNFSNEFEPAIFFLIARKSIVWVLLFFLISFFSAFIYLRYTPRIYEANTVLQINSGNNANKILDIKSYTEAESMEGIAGDLELLRSKVFLKRALSTLPLDVSYFEQGTFRSNEHYKQSFYQVEKKLKSSDIVGIPIYVKLISPVSGEISYTIGDKLFKTKFTDGEWNYELPHADVKITIVDKNIVSSPANKNVPYYFLINDMDNLANTYFQRLTITVLNDAAKTVKIVFRDNTPLKTADVVKSLTSEFISYDIERRTESAKNVLEFIDGQLGAVFERLKSSETSLQAFKRSNNVKTTQDGTASNFNRLNLLEDEIMHTEMEANVLSEISKKVTSDKKLNVNSLISILAGSDNQTTLASQLAPLQKLLIEREESLLENKPENESVKSMDYRINLQKNMLLESLDAIKSKLEVKKANLKKAATEFESKFYGDPTADVEYSRLQRLYSINEKFYTLLLERKTEYQISKAGFTSKHLILEKPATPSSAVYPNRSLTIIASILIGLLLSALVIILRYFLHNKITSLNEIIRHTNAMVSILGIVPKYKKNIPVSQLIVDKNPKSLIAEAFRSIRTNMKFMADQSGPKLTAVTSTVSGEGKTFVAINLAGIIAFSGKKVIILDLDMRKPKIHLGFGVENNKGMSTILSRMDPIENCIHHSSLENLDFITSGPIPPNPSELILSAKMREVIEDLKKSYDMIIIDNPPVGLVTDGIEIMRIADYPLYIFRAEYSKRSFIQNVDRLLNESQIKHLSVVLNGVDIENKNYGYNYGYGYGYGYGSGYGYYEDFNAEKQKEKKSNKEN